eukprot:jgi/Galph1/4603/GphlegSOOS_G3241.1
MNKTLTEEEVLEKIRDVVATQLGLDQSQVSNEASFTNDLGADSLDSVELVMSIENAFDIKIPDEKANKISNIKQLKDYVMEKLTVKRAEVTKKLANKMITLFTEIVREKVNNGEKVTIVGFGTFKAKHRKPKAVRNPRTEQKMIIPAARVPVFTVGTLRIASSFKNVQAIMHAPLGDDYFNVMKSMLERERNFTPVTTSVVDRHVLARGSQEKVINNISRKDKEFKPNLIILTPTCTSSILQEDLQNFVNRASLEVKADVLLADVNHYRVNELQAADKTLEQIIKFYLYKAKKENNLSNKKTREISANIIGITSLGFHHQHDLKELQKLLSDLNIKTNLIIPHNACVDELKNLTKAWFNIVPYHEIGLLTAQFLHQEFNMPFIDITPMGIIETARFIRYIQSILKHYDVEVDYEPYIDTQTRFVSQSAWFSRSIDCQNLTGKKAVVFGDSTHASSITKLLVKEMGINVLWAGTYCQNDREWFTSQVETLCKDIIISDDHNFIADLIAETEPDAIFGTQMERHIGKRLNIPCGVISSPVHIQNFPLSYRPFLGYEGSNQISDLIYNSFTLGMEDHLLEIFGGHDTRNAITNTLSSKSEFNSSSIEWTEEARNELLKIPGFVRNKVKKNTEKFAIENNLNKICLDTMYSAKEALKNTNK